jgi:hypothetical protein
MVKYSKNGSYTITGKDIDTYRFLTLKSALKLEMLGIKRRGASALSILKKEYGFKGNSKKVFAEVATVIGQGLGKSAEEIQIEIDKHLMKIK